jgi:TonB family protein
VLSITINPRGRVEDASVLRGLGAGLDESALTAARNTLWSPATIDGEPVRSTRRFNVRFTLQI